MKYFFPILMALVILAGISLVLTPYIAEQLFPAPTTSLRKADPQQVAQALAQWFATTPDQLSETQGVNQVSAQGNTAWFTFRVGQEPVRQFILHNQLQQQDLTDERLQQVFFAQNPPASWWQPASLGRQTCFIGTDGGRQLGLIYHAEQQRGFLVVRTAVPKASSGNF
jgi:hypothetical protein